MGLLEWMVVLAGVYLASQYLPVFNIFPGRGLRRDCRFPSINSVPGLMAVAKSLTGARRDARPISVSTQQVFSTMEEYLAAEMHGLISLGLLAGQAREGNRRMTFKGALFLPGNFVGR